jgi:hypothetical protein
MHDRLWVIGFVVWAVVGCGDSTEDPAETVSAALRAGGAPRLGQGLEVVAAGPDGDVSIFKGEVVGIEPVYQHNQTDLEVLRVHAARRGGEAEAPPAAVPPSPSLPAEMIRLLGFPLRPAGTFEGPILRLRGSVEIAGVGSPFNGKYLVTGVSHRFDVARSDGALFSLPEVDDEVLVAFVGGDPDRPVILGSLWNPDR